MSLGIWAMQAREHWKEFQPARFARLTKEGKLDAALKEASERTYREVTALEDAGYDPQSAWEMVRESYLFPPEEGAGLRGKGSPATCLMHAAIRSGVRTIEIEPTGLPRNAQELKDALKDTLE